MKVEEAVSRERDLHPNMDFYSATLYNALRIPVDMLTNVRMQQDGWLDRSHNRAV
jgi:citrate synthase